MHSFPSVLPNVLTVFDMRKDYYKILGITDDEKELPWSDFEKVVKNKFRKLALENHPDKMVGKTDAEKKAAEERFKEVSEAYEVLSDKDKRAQYDNPSSGFDFNMNFAEMSIDEIMRRFNMQSPFSRFGFHDFDDEEDNRVQQGTSIRIKVPVTLEEIYNGTKKKFKYKRREKCGNCNGTGLTEKSKEKQCPSCGGRGYVSSSNSFMVMRQTCPTCGGKGYFVDNPCPKCNGYGVVINDFETEISIPKGASHGMEINYRGLGNAAPHGQGINGDLIVAIYEQEHNKFKHVGGSDLYTMIEVPVVGAILGCDVKVETIGGKTLTAKIPPGTQEGDELNFRGYGLPVYGTNVYGNMIGVVKLSIPNSVNEDEKRLLEELRTKEHFKA